MKKTYIIILFLSALFFAVVFCGKQSVFAEGNNVKNYAATQKALINIVQIKGELPEEQMNNVKVKIAALSIKLDLTDEQLQQAEEISYNSLRKMSLYRTKFIEEKQSLIDLKKKKTKDSEIKAQKDIVSGYKSRMKITREKNMQNFEQLLNPDQQQEFSHFRSALKEILKQVEVGDREPRNAEPREDALQRF